MRSLVGVFREPEYSPGRVDDDAAILERTRDALAACGMTLRLGGVEILADEAPAAVLAMCQSDRALAALDRAAAAIPVMNHPDAIRACHRRETVHRLTAAGAPLPATRIVPTAAGRPRDVLAPCWVKRGDVHAMAADDVVFAATADALEATLADFAARGIAHAALQAHVEGVVVKFYGVADGRFFRCYTHEGTVPAPMPALWNVARAGAAALGLDVFGGDLVVASDGRPFLIDVNDWPSFARCRDEAADAIAGYAIDRLIEAAPSLQGQHG
ncbi:MAG: hypothetical protein IT294_18565 [Deltaproteobacteria bacterium]|nr:hypothetical protein [Deltaproteobacteria bacterium]